MKFTQVPSDAFETLQLNAGIIASGFNPATGAVTGIMGATTGGFTFASNPTYTDFGEDMDNVPANTKQLKRIQSYDPAISGTFLSLKAATAGALTGAADVSGNKITPREQLADSDFADVWVIGDYSNVNAGNDAGFIAVHLMDALNTAGIQWQSTKDGKGQFSFDFHGHYDIEDIETVPFEFYVKAGTAASTTP